MWAARRLGRQPEFTQRVPSPHCPYRQAPGDPQHLWLSICVCAATKPPPETGRGSRWPQEVHQAANRVTHKGERRLKRQPPHRVNAARHTKDGRRRGRTRSPVHPVGEATRAFGPLFLHQGAHLHFRVNPATNEGSWERVPPRAADERLAPRL